MNANWRQFIVDNATTPAPHLLVQLQQIFQQTSFVTRDSWVKTIGKGTVGLASLTCAAGFLMPILLNTYHIGRDYTSSVVSSIGTLTLNAANVYNISHLLWDGGQSCFDMLDQLIRKQTLPSLSFQLRPKTFSAFMTGGVVMSTLSYATLFMLFNNNWAENSHGRRSLEIGVMTATDLYHLIGIHHLGNLLMRRFTTSTHEQQCFKIEKEIDKFNHMTLSQFIYFVETLSPIERQTFGLTLAEEVGIGSNIETINGLNRNDQNPTFPQARPSIQALDQAGLPVVASQPNLQSSGGWFSLWRRNKSASSNMPEANHMLPRTSA